MSPVFFDGSSQKKALGRFVGHNEHGIFIRSLTDDRVPPTLYFSMEVARMKKVPPVEKQKLIRRSRTYKKEMDEWFRNKLKALPEVPTII